MDLSSRAIRHIKNQESALIPKNWSQGDITRDSVNIHYYRTGSSQGELHPPVLLIHGFTDNGLCWLRCAQALEGTYDVVMVDARNHGLSGTGPATLDALAADHAAVITALDLANVMVIGHSVGANTATQLAVDYPRLVTRLILEDPPWRHSTTENASADRSKRHAAFRKYVDSLSHRDLSSIIDEGKKRHPRWHADEFPPWAQSNQQVHRDAMDLMDISDWQPLVPQINCPTLLLHADGDGIVSKETATEVQQANTNIQAKLITGAGHNLRREQFEDFLQAVSAFMA